jgi:twitching motility two-component system response regulator PilG
MTPVDTLQEPLFQEAIQAARAGRKALARELFQRLQREHPGAEQVWMWSAAVAETPVDSMYCLHQALRLNPGNRQARSALEMQKQKTAGSAAPPDRNQGESMEARRPDPEPAGAVCPVCQAEGAGPDLADQCDQCGAVLDVRQLVRLRANPRAQEPALVRAIERLEFRQRERPSGVTAVSLAVAHLNLGHATKGLRALREAVELGGVGDEILGVANELGSRRLVLVADDSATVRSVVGGVLEMRGYRVVTAADGLEALAAMNRESPDLILLDASMPRMDGYQVCKVLKQNPETNQIPVLLVSGNAGLLDRMKGTVSGAAGYLEKPFSSEKLLALVQRHSARSATSR